MMTHPGQEPAKFDTTGSLRYRFGNDLKGRPDGTDPQWP